MPYGTVNADKITTSDGVSSAGLYGFKNRIINGAMVIDQRNAGAATANTINGYVLDRWRVDQSVTGKVIAQQNAASVTPPVGFINYFGITSQSAYSVLTGDYYGVSQVIEGLNCSDLAWGTASAATVTLSFWVRSSLTGTFGGSITNSGSTRSYPFTYTISAANTWEQKSITITGDTSGTWLTTNGVGIRITFGLGVGTTYSGTAGSWAGTNYVSATGATSVVGTNGATFYITGVQLEKGSTATSFDYRPYGTELALCQRYYYRISPAAIGSELAVGYSYSTVGMTAVISNPVVMRTAPSALEQSGTASDYRIYRGGAATNTTCSSVPVFSAATTSYINVSFTVASGLSNGAAGSIATATTAGYLGWSAEL